jgi:hypothetical protein
VVCANTESLALQSAQQTFRIRHRGDLAGRVQEAKETLAIANKYTQVFADECEALAKKDVSAETFEEIMRRAFPEQKRQLAANLSAVKIIRTESPRIPDDLRMTGYGAQWALKAPEIHGVWGGADQHQIRIACAVDLHGNPVKSTRPAKCPFCRSTRNVVEVREVASRASEASCSACGLVWRRAKSHIKKPRAPRTFLDEAA